MIHKTNCLIIILLITLLVPNSFAANLRTTKIEAIRNKPVLNSADLQVIDGFLADAISRLLGADEEDFTWIADIRRTVLENKSSITASAKEQYAERFSRSAATYLADAFAQLQDLPDAGARNRIMLNLLILLDNLQDLRLTKLALEMVAVENTPLRYWAVHAVTSPKIVEQLGSENPSNTELAQQIIQALKGRIHRESCSEILALIAKFAAALDTPGAQELLLKMADMRIKKYADWTVDNEHLDLSILRLLAARIISHGRADADAARRFAQLYSYAIQRYLKSMAERGLLTPAQKQDLVSVLVETEQRCIDKLTRLPQSTIKTAIERNKYSTLLAEHDKLLGGQGSPGRLLQALNFDYGANADGTRRESPLILPDRPERKPPGN